MFRRHPLLSLFTLGYLAIVGWVTLGPQPFDDGTAAWLVRLLDVLQRHALTDWITYDRLEFGANIAMFVPVGLFFLLLFGIRRWWLAILLGFALTVGIETTQLFIPGRVSDVRDVIANTTGAIVGVLFGLIVTTPKALRLARARTRALAHRAA